MTGTRLTQSVYCSTQQIDAGLCEAYLEVTMRSSNEEMVIQRRYKRFFDVISEIGGFNDLIIYSLWALYFSFNTFNYRKLVRKTLMRSLTQQNKNQDHQKVDEKIAEKNSKNESKQNQPQNLVVQKISSKFTPLPEYDLLVKLNSQSSILLKMVFLRCKALKYLLKKVKIQRKLKENREGKKQEQKGAKTELEPQSTPDQKNRPTMQKLPSAERQKQSQKKQIEKSKNRERGERLEKIIKNMNSKNVEDEWQLPSTDRRGLVEAGKIQSKDQEDQTYAIQRKIQKKRLENREKKFLKSKKVSKSSSKIPKNSKNSNQAPIKKKQGKPRTNPKSSLGGVGMMRLGDRRQQLKIKNKQPPKISRSRLAIRRVDLQEKKKLKK